MDVVLLLLVLVIIQRHTLIRFAFLLHFCVVFTYDSSKAVGINSWLLSLNSQSQLLLSGINELAVVKFYLSAELEKYDVLN